MAKKEKKEKEVSFIEERFKALNKAYKRGGSIYATEPVEKQNMKKKPAKISMKGRYSLTLMHFQFHLYELICTINDIPLDYYMLVDEEKVSVTLINDLELDDTFKRLSKLKWDESSSIDGLYFRGRFCTLLLYKIVRKSHDIVRSVYRDSVSSSNHKFKFYNVILDKWMNVVDNFVVTYLAAKQDYTPHLFKIYELLADIGTGENKAVLEQIRDTERLITAGREPEGVQANNITKIAYVLATGSLKMKKCPEYQENLSYKNLGHVMTQVGGLGYAIMHRSMKHDCKTPLLWKCFQQALPKPTSRLYSVVSDAPEAAIGVYALEFSKMFYRDTVRIHRLIDQLM